MKKFYIGSGIKNFEAVERYAKALKENGWKQTYNWVEEISGDISREDMKKYASLEKQGIEDSDVVIILLPEGRGSHIELGMALALDKKLFLCSEKEEDFSLSNTVAFYELPNVVKLVGTWEENLQRIIEG